MKNELMRQRYAEGRVPWDSPTPPPEITAIAQTLPVGRGLDLGCGYGRSCIHLAQLGWQMDGVDYVPQAIEGAMTRATAADVSGHITFHVGDATRLDFLTPSYDLIMDIGCMHSFPDEDLPRYRDGIVRLLREGGTYLLYAKLYNPNDEDGPHGVEETAVMSLF
jgi:SAM-dependent methyltransferase